MTRRRGSHSRSHRARPKEAERIGDVLSRLLARTGYAQTLASADWNTAWRQAAGAQWGAHSRPARLRRGVLEVMVRNSTVLQELSYKKKEILGKLCAEMPENTIGDIRFRVGAID